jgi:biofilm protein TabA
MKKSYLISVICLSLIFFFMNNESSAQSTGNQTFTKQSANKWVKSGTWAKGLKLKVHKSVNAVEFAEQYAKNQVWWDKAFEFLKNTDLETLKTGKYPLDGENVFVSVTEGPTKTMDVSKWEAHHKYLDIQYVIKGKEKMGKAPISVAKPLVDFENVKDIGFFSVEAKSAKYYLAVPGTFFIFFPSDAHRPSLKVEGFDTDKKLVVKIRVS